MDKLQVDKQEYLAGLILQVCRDQQSIAFYRKVARLLPEQAIFETLSEVREAIQLGRIRENPGAMFTDLIKRKAKELGMELVKEIKENEPKHEKLQDPTEFSTPAEIFRTKEIGPR